MSVGGTMLPEGGYWEIDNGWDVFGADGEKVGDVADVEGSYITVSKGFFFKTDMFVPVSAIVGVEDDRVYLNVTKDQIESLGWDRLPEADVLLDRETVSTGYVTAADADTLAMRTDIVEDQDTLRVPVVEEELQVGTRDMEQGRVHLHKDVIEDRQTVDVPLRQEEVRVTRRPVDTAYTGDVPAEAFQEIDIEVPVRGEEAIVAKQAVVREEVEIQKQVREHTEQVSDTVRREEVHVDESEVKSHDGGLVTSEDVTYNNLLVPADDQRTRP